MRALSLSALILSAAVLLRDLPDAAAGTAAKPPVVTSKLALWTGGTKLRGANIWVTRSYGGKEESIGRVAVGPAYTQGDFNRLAQLGANYVNISHAGIFTESLPFKPDPDAQARLDDILEKIAKANMFAVIAMRTGPGRSEFTFHRDEVGGPDSYFSASDVDETVWTDQATQDGWVKMWGYLAKRYKDNPVVVGYDLMVEPNSNSLVKADDPKQFYPARANTLYDWNGLYPRIVDAIRSVDPKTPILVQGMGYGGVAWFPYLKKSSDEGIVYSIHNYEPQEMYTHQGPRGSNPYPGRYDVSGDGQPVRFDKKWLDNLYKTVDRSVAGASAVAVTEFGVQRWVPNGSDYVRDNIDLFERRGWNHAIWAWSSSSLAVDWSEANATDYDEFDFLHGPAPSNHKTTSTSGLITVLKKNWSLNTLRPSNVAFAP